MRYGCFHYDPVGPSNFFYTDEKGLPRDTQFTIDDPAHLVEAVSAVIQGADIDHVVCNAAGLQLSSAINTYLKTKFAYRDCVFELNK